MDDHNDPIEALNVYQNESSNILGHLMLQLSCSITLFFLKRNMTCSYCFIVCLFLLYERDTNGLLLQNVIRPEAFF